MRRVIFTVLWLLCSIGICRPAQAETDEKPVSVSMYLGQEISFSDVSEGKLRAEKDGVISVSDKNIVRAVGKGRSELYLQTEEGSSLFAVIFVKENELLSGLSYDKDSFPPKVLGTGTFCVAKPAFSGMTCRYSSENSGIATVDNNGNVTPVAGGETVINIEVTDDHGGTYYYSVPIRILQPHFEKQTMNLAKGCTGTMLFSDAAGLSLSCRSSKPSVLSVVSSDSSGVKMRAGKKGSAVLTAEAAGVSFSCKITVTDPRLNKEYGFYTKNKKLSLKLSGINSASAPVWSTENAKIGTVSSSGKVKSHKMGSTVIHCDVDGRTLNFYLAVSSKTAVKAMRYGYRQLGKKKYSQARRMSRYYYDCSSFVYRSYRAAGKILVRRTSWAPVAADIGRYYVRKGKQIRPSGKTYSWNRLRPGDLICWGGPSARRNGRYKRIYHISIYIGNGKTMESSSTYNNVVIRDRERFTKRAVPVIVRPA